MKALYKTRFLHILAEYIGEILHLNETRKQNPMRVLFIISIVFSFFFLIIMSAATIGTKSERDRYYDHLLYDSDYSSSYDSFDSYDYLDDYYENKYVESTEIAASISLVFFVWAFVVFIMSVIIVKTTTSRVLSIIALVLTLLMTVWAIMVLDSPRSMSFDEVGVAWIVYALIILVFSIIGTIQAFRFHKSKNPPQPAFNPAFNNQFPPNPFLQQQPQQQWQQPQYPPQYPPQYQQQQQYPQQPQQPYSNPYNQQTTQNPFPPQNQNPFPPQNQNPAPPQNQNPPPPQNQNPPPPQNINPAPPQNPNPPSPPNPWAPPSPPPGQ